MSTTASMRPASVAFYLGSVLVLTIGAFCCFGLRLSAQTSGFQTNQRQSTTDLKSDDLLPSRIPVRIVESYSENGDRTLDKRSVEIRGADGGFEPYQDIEKETLKADASTVRTATRTFARDVNGRKSLVQVTEEEKHILSGGDSNVVRVTYNPDVNGRIQPVQREIVSTKKVGDDLEETDTTVMLTNINGGLAPAFKTHETRKRATNDTVETEETTWLPDVNGEWQVSEIRNDVTTQDAQGRKIEESISQPDADGKLSQISRTVSQESESTSEEKYKRLEAYSIDVPGTTRDGRLHLVQRKISHERSISISERATEEKVEQINPGDPNAGLRVSVVADGAMVSGPSGEQCTLTIRVRDPNGSFGIVSVDTTKSDRIPTIQIQQTPSEQPK
jgi:hypothetical protein